MEIKNIFKPFVKAFYKSKAFCIKNAPDIMIGAGVTTGIVATVVACKQTLKLDNINQQYNHDRERIAAAAETHTKPDGSEYTDSDIGHDMTAIAVRRVVNVAKTYALPAGLCVISVGLTLGGYGILKTRHAALVTAFGALQTTFNEYRERVREKYGEEEERKIYYGIKDDTVSENDSENGDASDPKTTAPANGMTSPSIYARFFDEYSTSWTRDNEYNKVYLRAREKDFNKQLITAGYVLLNDVYRGIGLQPTDVGRVCGWVYKPNDPNHKGDNYISFNMFNTSEASREFINGVNPSILLDFNVDGYILDKI